MPIEKSEGTTASERYLAQLCEDSFLKLWSYPNLYRDQGTVDGQGKEICDLLVVFGDDVIIFSDKSCAFPDSGNIAIDWSRWYRKAIKKSADQVFGAERWIRRFPQRVFVDRTCRTPLPIELPDPANCRVHRVVVALGAKQRCIQFFDNSGSGSMRLAPRIVGDAHCDPELGGMPFSIGQIDPNRGFVHVFDDVTLDIIMKELDTISDFASYLNRKEELIAAGQLGVATGEEDLLAYYLQNIDDEAKQHCFSLPDDMDELFIGEGIWSNLRQKPVYIAKKKADKISYLWDSIIQEFCEHTLADSLVGPSETSVKDAEIPLQVMARESRFRRRFLSDAMTDAMREAMRKCPDSGVFTRSVMKSDFEGTAYVFVLVPYPNKAHPTSSYEEYRDFRRHYATGYCMALAYKYRELKCVVGIGTELGIQNNGRSHDVVMCKTEVWTPEMEKYVLDFQSQAGVLQDHNIVKSKYHTNEYPDVGSVTPHFNGASKMSSGAKQQPPKKLSKAAKKARKQRQRIRKRRKNNGISGSNTRVDK